MTQIPQPPYFQEYLFPGVELSESTLKLAPEVAASTFASLDTMRDRAIGVTMQTGRSTLIATEYPQYDGKYGLMVQVKFTRVLRDENCERVE